MPKIEVTIKAYVDADEISEMTDLELVEYIGTDDAVILLELTRGDEEF